MATTPLATPVRNFRINTRFTKGTFDDVNQLTLDVEDALTSHPFFIKPPVSMADMETQRLAYQATNTESRKLGVDRTRANAVAKQVLVDSLMQTALYCQGLARHDLNLLLSSGFEVNSTNRTSGPLDPPSIKDILNNVSGQLTVRGLGVLNGRMYKARTSTDGGKTWTEWPLFKGARLMVLSPVVPGTVYMVEICAMGGSTGQSPWSNPVSIMAT
jgi:hypothetical protein